MESEMISISRKELDKLIRTIVKEELEKIKYVSDNEQREIEQIYGNAVYEKRDKKDYVKL